MGILTFNGTTSKAVSSAAPSVTAVPCCLIALASHVPTAAAQSVGGLFNNAGTSASYALRFDSGESWRSIQPTGAVSAPQPSREDYEVGISIFLEGTICEIYGNYIGNSARSSGAGSSGINRLAIGVSEFSVESAWLNGSIVWFGVLSSCPTVPEMRRILDWKNNHPMNVVRHRMAHFYQANAGAVLRDLIGGLDLTVTAATFSDGGPGFARMGRDVYKDPLRPMFGRRARLRQSVGDTYYEVLSKTWGADQFPLIEAWIDQTNNQISVRINAGTTTVQATVGTYNAPQGSRFFGNQLVDGVAGNTTDVGLLGYFTGIIALPAAPQIGILRSVASAWGELAIDISQSVLLPTAGGTIDLTPYFKDPPNFGWQITSAVRTGGLITATVGVGSDGHSVTFASVVGNVGEFVTVLVTAHNLVDSSYQVTTSAEFTFVLGGSGTGGGYANGYTAQHRIDIYNGTGSAHTNFPVYWRSSDYPEVQDTLQAVANGGVVTNSSGYDIRFELANGTVLKYERLTYDPVSGIMEAFIKLPSVANGTPTSFFIYAGKSGETDQQDISASGVWSDYAVVWNARTGVDRSGNARHLTPTGVTSGNIIYDAGDYNGTTARMQLAGSGAASLVGPTLLGTTPPTKSSVQATTITQLGVTPSNDALLLVGVRSRHSGVHTHTAPTTTGITNLSAWTLIDQATIINAALTIAAAESWWWAKVTGAAGTGTVIGHLGANAFQQEIEVYEILNADLSVPIRQVATKDVNATGTTATATFTGAPLTTSIVMSGLGQLGALGTIVDTAGWTRLTGDASGTNQSWQTQWDTANTGVSVPLSGLANNQPHIQIAFEVAAGGAGADVSWIGGAGWANITVQAWIQEDADSITANSNRGIILQGVPGAALAVCGLTVYVSGTDAGGTINDPISASFVMDGGRAFAVSDANRRSSSAQLVHVTKASGAAPTILTDGVARTASASGAATGNLLAQAGDFYLGDGPGSGALPRTGPFKGLEEDVRIRLSVLSSAWCALERKNMWLPYLTYAVGAKNISTDVVQAPIIKPCDVTCFVGVNLDIDVLAGAISPSGRTLSIFSPGAPASGIATIFAGKIRYNASSAATTLWTALVTDGVKKSTVIIRAVSTSQGGGGGGGSTTTRIGFGHVSVASTFNNVARKLTPRGRDDWGLKLRANTFFTGQGHLIDNLGHRIEMTWSDYANKGGVWTNNSDLSFCRANGILPIVTIPVWNSLDNVNSVLGGSNDAAIDFLLSGLKSRMGTDQIVIRIGHEMEQGNDWDAERFGTAASDLDNWKNCWRYIAKKVRDKFGGPNFALTDWCITKGADRKGTGHVWKKSDYWPNRRTTNPPAGLNDATGLLYPSLDLVDVVGLDHYDASPIAGRPVTYSQWVSEPGGPMTHLAWSQARGKPMAIDETGLRPYDVGGGTLANPLGGGDNPTYVQYWYNFLNDPSVDGTNVLWYNWFDLSSTQKNHPEHCHAIYPTTVYAADGSVVGMDQPNSTRQSSQLYKTLWGS